MERGSAVGTAGVKSASTESDEYVGEENHRIFRSVCGRLQFASPRRPGNLAEGSLDPCKATIR
eukprot:374718-Amphidinium_carterae.1